MKKIAAFLSVVFLVVLSGCLGPELKDCGTDRDCFMEAMEVCEPAKVRNEMPALDGSTTTYMEVRGGTVDECTFYYKFTDATIPSDATAEERAEAMALIGSDMTCVAPVQTFITGMQDASFLESCEGPLKDLMMGWMESVPSPASSPEVTPTSESTPSPELEGHPYVVEACYEYISTTEHFAILGVRNLGDWPIYADRGTLFSVYEEDDGYVCSFVPLSDIAPGASGELVSTEAAPELEFMRKCPPEELVVGHSYSIFPAPRYYDVVDFTC